MVDSASIEVNRCHRRAKTARLDVHKCGAGRGGSPPVSNAARNWRACCLVSHHGILCLARLTDAQAGRALAGLTPTPYQSGQASRELGITKAGNGSRRIMAVEIAWGWVRFQPESPLTQWYQARFGRGIARLRKIGMMALAPLTPSLCAVHAVVLGGESPLSRCAWSRRTREAPARHREVGSEGRVERTCGPRDTNPKRVVVQSGRAGTRP